MEPSSRRWRPVFENFLTIGTGEVVARGMHSVAFLLLARALGKEALGAFGLATAATTYFVLVVTQGFDPIAVRDVARRPDDLQRYTERVLGVRLVLALGMCGAVALGVLVARPEVTTTRLFLVLCVSYLANALTPRWCFLAIERPRPLAIAGLLSQACFLVAAALIHSPSQVVLAAGALVLGELAGAVFLLVALRRVRGPFSVSVDRTFSKYLVTQSWPVTLSLLLGNMMYTVDVLALGLMGRGDEIGVYLACYRCVTVFGPMLSAVPAVAAPLLARSYPDYERVRRSVRGLTVLAGLVLGVTALAIALVAPRLLDLLFGAEYVEGAKLLRILVWILPLQGFRSLLRPLLVAFHVQRDDTKNVAWGVVTNVAMDVALIPFLGALGCAISTVSSELVFYGLTERSVHTRVRRSTAHARPSWQE